jgi:hypothetical protein
VSEASIRAAIGAAITASSGLAADRVRWGRQGLAAARPSTPGAWISMLELGETDVGRPRVRYVRNPMVFADKPVAAVVTGTPGALTVTGHALQTGDGPVRLATTGTAPGGLAVDVDYWAIRLTDDTLRLALSHLGAVETPAPVAISSAGTGAHRLVDTAATLRAGAECLATTQSTGLRTVSVQCYGGDAVDDDSPLSILRRVRAALELPAIRGALWASGVGLQRAGAPADRSVTVTPGRFEPRAVMEIAFYVPGPALTEPETIIEHVSASLTVSQ